MDIYISITSKEDGGTYHYAVGQYFHLYQFQGPAAGRVQASKPSSGILLDTSSNTI
jgi:hypothetical protein